jgi:hypothetical protein
MARIANDVIPQFKSNITNRFLRIILLEVKSYSKINLNSGINRIGIDIADMLSVLSCSPLSTANS